MSKEHLDMPEENQKQTSTEANAETAASTAASEAGQPVMPTYVSAEEANELKSKVAGNGFKVDIGHVIAILKNPLQAAGNDRKSTLIYALIGYGAALVSSFLLFLALWFKLSDLLAVFLSPLSAIFDPMQNFMSRGSTNLFFSTLGRFLLISINFSLLMVLAVFVAGFVCGRQRTPIMKLIISVGQIHYYCAAGALVAAVAALIYVQAGMVICLAAMLATLLLTVQSGMETHEVAAERKVTFLLLFTGIFCGTLLVMMSAA